MLIWKNVSNSEWRADTANKGTGFIIVKDYRSTSSCIVDNYILTTFINNKCESMTRFESLFEAQNEANNTAEKLNKIDNNTSVKKTTEIRLSNTSDSIVLENLNDDYSLTLCAKNQNAFVQIKKEELHILINSIKEFIE